MPSQEKKDKVKQIKKWFDRSDSLLLLRYRGLTVSDANELRERVRGMESELRVVKNTLTRIAIAGSRNEELSPMLEGPVAVVFVRQDPGPVARALREFARGRKDFFLLGGMVEGRAMDGGQVEAFAMLPTREVLVAQMLGTLKAPLAGAVGVGAGVIRRALGLFQAIAEKAPAAPTGDAGAAGGEAAPGERSATPGGGEAAGAPEERGEARDGADRGEDEETEAPAGG